MSASRIALIGAGGQLATDLARTLEGTVIPLTHSDIEITDMASVVGALDDSRPDFVLNTAGYNLVDKAEDEPQQAFAVNAFGVRNLALYCADQGLPLLHVSTDYVFNGDSPRSRPFDEEDCPRPCSVYGASKLAGEHFIQAHCPAHFIVRTCGLYGVAATKAKGNFIETMLRLSETREELNVVDDQKCTPSYTADVASAISSLVKTEAWGVYHVTNSGTTSWCELAREIFRLTGRDVQVNPISSKEFGAKARRPGYSVLSSRKLKLIREAAMPTWTDALARYLQARK